MKNSSFADYADRAFLIDNTVRFFGVPVRPEEKTAYRWLLAGIVGVHVTLAILALIMH